MKMKIGVFDSGIGGITVLSELRRRMSFVDYVYLGDTAHLPYGTKSPTQIEKLSVQCAKKLKTKKVDALIVACNTASSLALPAIRDVMKTIPVLGVVEPGIQAALSALKHNQGKKKKGQLLAPILVLATRATVQSHAYGRALRQALDLQLDYQDACLPIIEQACPVLVPMIEDGWIDHPLLHLTVAEYVKPHLHLFPAGIAVLGCTHYPWIQPAFEKALPGWTVVNSAGAVAELLEKSALFQNAKALQDTTPGKVEWIFTDPEAVPAFAKKFII